MRNVEKQIVEKIKTHILHSITFPRKSCRLWNNVGKYSRAEQATHESTAHALRMLNN